MNTVLQINAPVTMQPAPTLLLAQQVPHPKNAGREKGCVVYAVNLSLCWGRLHNGGGGLHFTTANS